MVKNLSINMLVFTYKAILRNELIKLINDENSIIDEAIIKSLDLIINAVEKEYK